MNYTLHKDLQTRPVIKISVLCLSLVLTACQKPKEEPVVPSENQSKIELIQQDVIPVEQGTSTQRTTFSGTIKAVNQSSIQSQFMATATAVNVQVGQQVSRGQALVELNNQDNASRLAQSKANLASAQAQAQQALNMVQRKKRLYDQGFISKVEYEQSQVDYKAQLETVKAQQANVDISVKANQDGILKSPISGIITKRAVEPGQTVSVGQTLLEIVDTSKLEIQAKVSAEQQNALKVGNSIEYSLQGNPQKLTATLTRISPIADQASRQIEFFAQPNQAIHSLSIGAFIDGSILGNSSIQGQKIPLDTIQDLQNKPFVWTIRQQKLKQVPIKILEQLPNQNLAIVQGLQATDLISKVKFSADDIDKSVLISSK